MVGATEHKRLGCALMLAGLRYSKLIEGAADLCAPFRNAHELASALSRSVSLGGEVQMPEYPYGYLHATSERIIAVAWVGSQMCACANERGVFARRPEWRRTTTGYIYSNNRRRCGP